MATKKHETREGWLRAATEKFRPMFKEHKAALPRLSKIQFAVSPLAKRRMGACWPKGVSKDEATCQVTICASVDDPVVVLDTLLHELIHVALGHEAAHGPEFKALATKLGLTGPATSTEPGEALLPVLVALVKQLGKYPHTPMTKKVHNRAPPPLTGRDVTLKSVNEDKFEKLRVVMRRWMYEQWGPPLDPDGDEMIPSRQEKKEK